MKPQTEKPSEPFMKFFTPDRFIKFNSLDDEEADRADEDWETALRDYRKHLDGLRDQMPAPVKELAKLDLHDAELLAVERKAETWGFFPLHIELAILSLKQGDEVRSLIYFLWDQVRQSRSKASWPFSKQHKHWLYDEVDTSPSHRGAFLHRVLLSDGTVMEIPFVSVQIHGFSLNEKRENDTSRQIA